MATIIPMQSPARRDGPALVAARRRTPEAGDDTDTPTGAGRPAKSHLDRLGILLAKHAPRDGIFELPLRGVHAVRRSRSSREPLHGTYRPALCIVAQGSKLAMLGREVFPYDASRMLVFSVDLPLAGEVTRATTAKPFLGLRLDLNPERIAVLVRKVFPKGAPKASGRRGIYISDATDAIVDAATRLVALMADAVDARLLGPLVVDEILLRLLRSAIGGRVAQIGEAESGTQRVATAIAWIRSNFAQPVSIDHLAELVHMSVSSFHQHFKAVTSMSPLQYQKVLRLQEARRLMLFHGTDAVTSCRRVGYVSPSQFSREYARVFGSAPTKDIARLRATAIAD